MFSYVKLDTKNRDLKWKIENLINDDFGGGDKYIPSIIKDLKNDYAEKVFKDDLEKIINKIVKPLKEEIEELKEQLLVEK